MLILRIIDLNLMVCKVLNLDPYIFHGDIIGEWDKNTTVSSKMDRSRNNVIAESRVDFVGLGV